MSKNLFSDFNSITSTPSTTSTTSSGKSLVGKKVVLRALTFGDASKIQKLAGDEEVAKTTASIPHPYPQGAAESFVKRTAELLNKQSALILAICQIGSNDLIGVVSLDFDNCGTNAGSNAGTNAGTNSGITAELGYWVGRPYWGQGFATEAAQLIVHFGFAHTELKRISARHMVANSSSGVVMQKLGMTFEGVARSSECRNGVYSDIAMYGLLRQDFIGPSYLLAKDLFRAAYITGDFKLRSGKTSHEYFDKYRFESDPWLLKRVAYYLAAKIPQGTELLAGLEMGGIPIATALSSVSGIPAVFVRKKAKEYGTCLFAEGAQIKDRQVCVIEDVITTGGQVIQSSKDLRADGAKITDVLCVVQREVAATQLMAESNLKLQNLFTMDDLKS